MALLVAVVASIGKRCAKEGHELVNQKQFYKGSARRRVRDAYIAERVAIDGGVCEVCGVELGKIAHHKIRPDEEGGILSSSYMSADLPQQRSGSEKRHAWVSKKKCNRKEVEDFGRESCKKRKNVI